MRTRAKLKNFTSSDCKKIILRNLNRILDIRIIDLDENDSTITFLYGTSTALEKVKRELKSIGFPICRLWTNNSSFLEKEESFV